MCIFTILWSWAGLLFAEPDTLTVLTYNIHHAQGTDERIDLDRIASVIKAVNPHIVCLQEVDRNLPRTRHIDMPRIIAEKLGMEVAFEPNYQFTGGDYGNATLSTLPILGSRNIALPNPISAEPRGCLVVTVEWLGTPIQIMNTHLGLNGQERLAQAEAIVNELGDHPVILAGDMNENATAPGMKVLMEHLNDTFDESKATLRATIPVDKPTRRIDYIFSSRHWETVLSSIIHNDVTRVASDHLPYETVLRLSAE